MTIIQLTEHKHAQISEMGNGVIITQIIQLYNNDSEVLKTKTFATLTKAHKWVEKLKSSLKPTTV